MHKTLSSSNIYWWLAAVRPLTPLLSAVDVIETDLELAPGDVTMSGFGGGLPPNGHFSPAGHVPGGVSPGGQYAAPRYPLQPRQDDFDPIRHARSVITLSRGGQSAVKRSCQKTESAFLCA